MFTAINFQNYGIIILRIYLKNRMYMEKDVNVY